MINNTITILDPVFEAYPNIQVIQFGYDILYFGGALCGAEGSQLIADCDDVEYCINSQFVKIQYSYCDYIATLYPNNYNTPVMLGSLQAYDNVPDASLGNPNLNYWSPKNLMMNNCIHPTQKGFSIIFDNLWDEYFSHVINNNNNNNKRHQHPNGTTSSKLKLKL